MVSPVARRIADAVATAFAAAILAAGITAVRTLQVEQVLNERALLAIATIAAGAGLAGGAWRLIAPILAPLPALLRVPIAVLVLMAAIAGCSAALVPLVDFDLAEASGLNDRDILDAVTTHLAPAYLMLLAGWPLLFPWPLPVLAGLLAIWPAPRFSTPVRAIEPEPEPDLGRVELALRRGR
jgi:hypothetical protein